MAEAAATEAVARCQGALEAGCPPAQAVQPVASATLGGFKQGLLSSIQQAQEAMGNSGPSPGAMAVQGLAAKGGYPLTAESIARLTGMA